MLPLIPAAARHVRGEQHFRALERAYNEPQFIAPDRSDPEDRERRCADGYVVVVSRSTGAALWIGTYEQSDEPSHLLTEGQQARQEARSTKKGPSGSQHPTSYAEVIERLRAHGCEVRSAHRHHKVILPNGVIRSIPKTTSDWRAIYNTVTMFRHLGVDIRRPAPGTRQK